jgi:uncharacterized protein (DUF885 family)
MNKFGLIVLAAILTLLSGCKTVELDPPLAKPAADTSRQASELFSRYYEERLKLYPLEATLAGDHRYDDLLPNNLTESYRAAVAAFYRRHLIALNQLSRSQLSPEELLSQEVLQWECEINLKQLRFPTHLLPLNQFESLHLQIGQWAGGTAAQPFKTVRDYDNWLKRLDGFVQWCATAVTNLEEGAKRGVVLPKALIRKVIPQMADLAKGSVEEHLFSAPVRLMPAAFSPADKTRLTQAYATMVRDRITPAFQRLHHYLTNDYLAAGRESSGIYAIPQGREFYQLQIRAQTTTDLTANEIFELGQREVQRLLREMEQVKQRVGFTGDLRAFFDHVRSKPELMPFREPRQVLENFQAIHRKMQPALERLFRSAPKTGFEIRRTEAFREATASAEYIQGSLDGTRPGIFYVPIPNVTEYNLYADEDLFLHEAIPGHHYQISLQQENEKLPQFRRTLWYGAYGEGWALYCESLGSELGLYTDPYQYFGMLSAEMHRAIRLVVDTGLHAKGWSREQAIQFSLEHEAEPESSIIAEVERYMAWPGQALSYKIGQLKIRELRAKAERALGSRFDLREFHDRILESGCVPLRLLEQKIERWIRQQRGNPNG